MKIIRPSLLSIATMFALLVASQAAVGRPKVHFNTHNHQLATIGTPSTKLYLGSTIRGAEVYVSSLNVTSLCCLTSEVNETSLSTFNRTKVFGGFEPHAGTPTNECTFHQTDQDHTQTGSTLPNAVKLLHVTNIANGNSSLTTGKLFTLEKQNTETTRAYMCRGIWNIGSASLVTHSASVTNALVQTPSGLKLNRDSSAVEEYEYSGNSNGIKSVIFLSAKEKGPSDAEPYRGTYGFNLVMGSTSRYADSVFSNNNAYTCAVKTLSTACDCVDTTGNSKADTADSQYQKLGTNFTAKQTTYMLNRGRLHVYARPCIQLSQRVYAGDYKKMQISSPIGKQETPRDNQNGFFPSTLTNYLNDGTETSSISHIMLNMHSTGFSYNIPLLGRELYKDFLPQSTLDKIMYMCTKWSYKSNGEALTETCEKLNGNNVINIPANLAYGKAKFRWKIWNGAGTTAIYSHYSHVMSWGWHAGMVDVSIHMKHYGQPPFKLNKDSIPSHENVIQHLKLYNDAEKIHTNDKFTVSVPTNVAGAYTCYKTENRVLETSIASGSPANPFPNLCKFNTTNNTMECISGAHKKTSDFQVFAKEYSSLTTVVLQNCNPNVELAQMWGRNSANQDKFNGLTSPTGEYKGACAFSSAMVGFDGAELGDTKNLDIYPVACNVSNVGSKGIPYFATSLQKIATRKEPPLFMYAGDGFIELFPFNAAPINPVIVVNYVGMPTNSPASLSATPKAYPGSKIVITKGGNAQEKAFTRRVCWTVADGESLVQPDTPSCKTLTHPQCSTTFPIEIQLTRDLAYYKFVACNTLYNSQPNKHFKPLSSVEVKGYTGNSNYTKSESYFAIGHDFKGHSRLQRCFANNMVTSFTSFERSNQPTDPTQNINEGVNNGVVKQTVHKLTVDAWIAAATPDTSGAGLQKQLYGFNVAPSDQEAEVMRAADCTCETVDNTITDLHNNITSAVTKALVLLKGTTRGLYAINSVKSGSSVKYQVHQCVYNVAGINGISQLEGFTTQPVAGAVGLQPGLLKTKYLSGSMCLRKLKMDADVQHIMSTRTSATLGSERMVDNFAGAEQPANELTCVRLAEDSIHKSIVHGKNPYPLSGFQIKTALSAETSDIKSTYVPTVQVIQATAGSTLCNDFANKKWRRGADGATSPNTGFFANPTCGDDNQCIYNGTACKTRENTFEAILGINSQIASTLGHGAQVNKREAQDITTPPSWKINDEKVLDCKSTPVAQTTINSVNIVRFKCNYNVGTRVSSATSNYKQPVGSCNKEVTTAQGKKFYKTGAVGAARIEQTGDVIQGKTCVDPGSKYHAVVTKWIQLDTDVSGNTMNVTHYLIEADQYNYNSNVGGYKAFGAFVKSATDHSMVGPSTSALFTVILPPGPGHELLEAQIQSKDSNVGMVVTTCKADNANTYIQSRDAGKHMPSFMRSDLLDKGQKIGYSTNRIEMQSKCSDDFSKTCSLGSNGETQTDATNCGYYNSANTLAKRCGVRKIPIAMVRTNNYMFQSEFDSSADSTAAIELYSGYLGKSSVDGVITNWMKVNQDVATNRLHTFNADGSTTSQPSFMGPSSWGIYSWTIASDYNTRSTSTQPNSRLDNGIRFREFNVGTTVIPLVNQGNIRWDNKKMEPHVDLPGGGQSIRSVRCTLPSPLVTKVVSAVSTDLALREHVSYTTTSREIVRSAQWLSFQLTRRFQLTSSSSSDKFSGYTTTTLDLNGNPVKFLSGRKRISNENEDRGMLLTKIRLQTALKSDNSFISIFHGRMFRLTATLSAKNYGAPEAASQHKRTCEFGAISDHTRDPSNITKIYTQLDSECTKIFDKEAINHVSTNETLYDYLAPKCGTSASSVLDTVQGSSSCSVITDQGVDMALLDTPHNRQHCPYYEDRDFESATLTGIDLTVSSLDERNKVSDCQDPKNAKFWYLKESPVTTNSKSLDSTIEMCSVTKESPKPDCKSTSTQFTEFTVDMSGVDTRMSDALVTSRTSIETLQSVNVATKSAISLLYPGLKIKEKADIGTSNVKHDKEAINSVTLLDVTQNDFTAKIEDKNKPNNPDYMTMQPTCNYLDDSANKENKQRNTIPAICVCVPQVNALMKRPSNSSLYGFSKHGMNKIGQKMARNAWGNTNILQGGTIKYSNLALTKSVYGAPSASESFNPYSSFISFSTEAYVSERSGQAAVRPNVETALVYACLTPRSYTGVVTEGVRLTESYPVAKSRPCTSGADCDSSGESYNGQFTNTIDKTTPRTPLCPNKHDVLVYLHWGSKNSFDYLVSSSKLFLQIPRCTEERRSTPIGTDQTRNHGQAIDASDANSIAEVFDLSDNIVSGVRTVKAFNDNPASCDTTKKSGKFRATDEAGGAHVTYTNDNKCMKSSNPTAYNTLLQATHDNDIYSHGDSSAFLDKMKKVKAFNFDLQATGKYGIYINEVFESATSAYHASTLTLDSKLFGAFARSAEIKEIIVITETDMLGRRSQRSVVNSKRQLLSTASGNTNNIAHSGSSSVAKCQHTSGAQNSVETYNGTTLHCASFKCDDENVRITTSDSSGLSFNLECVQNNDDNNDTIIWTAFALSLIGTILVLIILTHCGYMTWCAKKVEAGVKKIETELKSVL